MTKLRIFLLCLVLAFIGHQADAALFGGGEAKAFDGAKESYRLKMWERAEREFAEFVKDHPKSERLTEAILLQAQAQFEQRKYAAVVTLLTGRLADAGNFADQFLYWTGQAQFLGADYRAAAATFGRLAREFPASSRRLEAAVNEAAAFAKLGEWARVVELLKQSDGAFRQAEYAAKGSQLAARGFLLLAEAQLALKDFPSAEVALGKAGVGLSGDLEWQRRFLLCQMLAASGRAEEAVRESAGMITAAEGARQWELLSDSVVFRAELLEHLGRQEEALATWRRNLTNAPVARQRQALSRITALAIQQNQLEEATQTLELYLNQFTNAAAADVAWLTLGELHLKQHVGKLPSSSTNGLVVNHLAVATNCFGRLLKSFPGSAYVGLAQLNLGWCFWIENNYAESEVAFDVATKRLPRSEDLAVARFKLADAQFLQTNYASALANYQAVLQLATNWPAVNAALRIPASYQALRASLELTNAVGAEEALRGIWAGESAGPEAAGSVLLVAQSYLDANQPQEAQRWFAEFVQKFPESALRPEAELLVARLREEQGDWASVAQAYDDWLAQFATNRLRAQVEFQRALAAARAGDETNALRRFTNFVAQFATDKLAPRAQWWVADYHYGREEFATAELNYKLLFQNWPASELAREARMMAGRAAVGRSGYPDAIEHFTSLTSDTNCPPDLRAQAFFAYGGTLMRAAPAGTNKVEDLEKARQVFAAIIQLYPTNLQAALAWGEIGNCALQLAATDPAYYSGASNAYQQLLTFPAASVAARSQALVGLAIVLEKQAQLASGAEQTGLLTQAREYALDVFLDKHLGEAELPDLFWKKRAGLTAATVSEALSDWPQALELYRELLRQKLLPAEVLERKISNAEKQSRVAAKIN